MDDETIIRPGQTCDDCGACCLHMVRPPFYRLGDPAWAWLVLTRPDLAEEIDADIDAHPGDDERPCLWLDLETRRCRHYELRPEICRDFEPGCYACIRHRVDVGLEEVVNAARLRVASLVNGPFPEPAERDRFSSSTRPGLDRVSVYLGRDLG